MNDNLPFVLSVLGIIFAPIFSFIGMLITEYRQKKRDIAISLKEEKETEAKKTELQVIMDNASMAAMTSYSGIITSLRDQVDNLIKSDRLQTSKGSYR